MTIVLFLKRRRKMEEEGIQEISGNSVKYEDKRKAQSSHYTVEIRNIETSV